jgi:hypothetical protein
MRTRCTPRRPGRENGAIGFMAAGVLLILCGFCGLALDLSRIYDRKMEMQGAADGAALAAAIELDGTKAGIARAARRASRLFGLPRVPRGPGFDFRKETLTWSDSALEFGATPDGPWMSRAAAASKSEPNGLLYARVDTAGAGEPYDRVSTWFMSVVSDSLVTVAAPARAVAGPTIVPGQQALRTRVELYP